MALNNFFNNIFGSKKYSSVGGNNVVSTPQQPESKNKFFVSSVSQQKEQPKHKADEKTSMNTSGFKSYGSHT